MWRTADGSAKAGVDYAAGQVSASTLSRARIRVLNACEPRAKI